jgi:hypothetical protein
MRRAASWKAAKNVGSLRAMDVRYVEEQDRVCQALLEIYVSTVTNSPYNEFKTT